MILNMEGSADGESLQQLTSLRSSLPVIAMAFETELEHTRTADARLQETTNLHHKLMVALVVTFAAFLSIVSSL